jgi:hypothetical protein
MTFWERHPLVTPSLDEIIARRKAREAANGYYLYKQSPEDTVYRVENSQGHGDDVFMFSEPIADPGDEADDDTFWSFIKFAEKAFDKPIRPEEGWKLTAAAIEAGWSREDNGGLCFWLADRAAKIIKTKEEKK